MDFRVRLWLPFCVCVSVMLVLLAYHDRCILMTLSKNYLLVPETKLHTGKYLVFNPKCQVPELQVWSLQILSIVGHAKVNPRCALGSTVTINGTIKDLTFVKKELLIINKSALAPLGWSIEEIECCYQLVECDEKQNITHYDYTTNFKYELSQTCYPMAEETQLISGLVKVTCGHRHRTRNGTHPPPIQIHTDFHLIALLPNKTNNDSNPKDKILQNKLEYWKERSKTSNDSLPPSVLIIGVDSTSRLNFRRMLPGVVSLLKNDLQAVELKGYTKVGMNSFPNLIPLLTSLSEEEMYSSCRPDDKKLPLDMCQFIWNYYSDQNYLTAVIEDYPTSSSLGGGFAKTPADIYTRHWMLAAYKHNDETKCLGYQRSDQVLLACLQDLVGLSVSRRIPFYIFTWFSDYSHDKLFGTQAMDASLTNAILKMKTSGWLDNTVLIVMSDHGHRFPPSMRHTLTGWYEDKLPALWIKVGENVKKGKDWMEGLRHNSNQLVTVYDIHQTMRNVLEPELNSTRQWNERPPRGVTLFQKVPDRSCEEAGVPVQFCACTAPVEFKASNKMLEQATGVVIETIRTQLSSSNDINCNRERVKAYSVTARAILPKSPIPQDLYVGFTGNASAVQEQDVLDGNAYFICGIKVNLYSWTVEVEAILGFNVSTAKFYSRHVFVISWSKKIRQCYLYIQTN